MKVFFKISFIKVVLESKQVLVHRNINCGFKIVETIIVIIPTNTIIGGGGWIKIKMVRLFWLYIPVSLRY